MAVYARKCGISYEELEKDALELIPILDARTTHANNHFDAVDVLSALKAYEDNAITYRRETIQHLTNIEIKPNKRNGRTLEKHLAYCRLMKQTYKVLGEREHIEGRKANQKDKIKAFLDDNPQAKTKDITEALGITNQTVYNHKKELLKDYQEQNTPLAKIPNLLLSSKERIDIALKANPTASNIELAEITGLHRKTIAKYKNSILKN